MTEINTVFVAYLHIRQIARSYESVVFHHFISRRFGPAVDKETN